MKKLRPRYWRRAIKNKLPICGDRSAVAMSPPIQYLFEAFRRSPYAAAPERAAELNLQVTRTGICVHPDALATSWKFEAIPNLGERIFVGNRTLERLWAYVYGYATIIAEIQKAGASDLRAIENREEYSLAFHAIDWAHQTNIVDAESPWPDWLPDPGMVRNLEYIHVANELFLITAGRILLHEIAHVVFAKAGTISEDPKEEEFRADEWADRWMLEKWGQYGADIRVFIKRCMGIACSHAPALVLGFRPSEPSATHPPPVHRIKAFLGRMRAGDPSAKRKHDFPAAFLWMIYLKTLLENGVIREVVAVPTSYTEAFDRYAEHFECNDGRDIAAS